jgi:hypothetical protein
MHSCNRIWLGFVIGLGLRSKIAIQDRPLNVYEIRRRKQAAMKFHGIVRRCGQTGRATI